MNTADSTRLKRVEKDLQVINETLAVMTEKMTTLTISVKSATMALLRVAKGLQDIGLLEVGLARMNDDIQEEEENDDGTSQMENAD